MKEKINLKKYVQSINKEYPNHCNIPAVSFGASRRFFIKSGIAELDKITGGGYPQGKLTLISGDCNSGKTYIALCAAAAVTKRGGYVAWFDNDYTFDKARALEHGINPEHLFLVHALDTGEALDIALAFARSGACDLIVFDTLTSLVPRANHRGDENTPIPYDVLNMDIYESIFERALPIFSALQQTLIATTLTYIRPGVYYGNPETIEGGRSIRYYAGLILNLNHPIAIKKAPIKDIFAYHYHRSQKYETFSVAGLYQHVKCHKNKFAPPFKDCHFIIPIDKEKLRSAAPFLRSRTDRNGIAKDCDTYKFHGYCSICCDSLSDFYGKSCKGCPLYEDEEHPNSMIFISPDCMDYDTYYT